LENLYKTKPFQHQLDVLSVAKDKKYWAFFLEPGLGKSKLLIDNAAHLYRAGEIKALVICTVKAMCPSFEFVEVPTHMPDDISHTVIRYDAAKVSTKSFKSDWVRFVKFDGLRVFIFNVDAAPSEKLLDLMRDLYKVVGNNFLMGVDESTTVKTHTAVRSKAVVKLSRAAKYRRIMTGTPVTNSPLEVFGQAMVLEAPEKILGHKSFYSFRNYFATLEKKTFGNRSFQVVTGYQNVDELKDLLGTFSSIIKKEDALDLPEKVYSTVLVEMPKDQRRLYNKLRSEAIIELDQLGESVEVTNILTMMVKLHQIVCGQLKYQDDSGKDVYVTIENNRLQTLMDIVELEIGTFIRPKIVVWSVYKQSIRDIVAALKKEYGDRSVIEFHGDVSQSDREVAASRFQDPNDPSMFFVGNPQSAGMGLTLTQASLAIYYSNDYSLERRIQSEDRIHRIGQKLTARYIDLVSQDTVDEKIIAALKSKKNLADRVVVSNWMEFL